MNKHVAPQERAQLLLQRSKHPVIFGVNGIGDHFLVLPAMRALCQLFPQKLTVVCYKSYALPIWDELGITRFVHFDYTDETSSDFDSDELASRIGSCDLFISLLNCQYKAITRLMTLLKPKASIGFNPDYYAYTSKTNWRESNFSLNAFSLAQVIDPHLTFAQFAYLPRFGTEHANAARELRKIIPPEYKILALHTDSKPDKTWPTSRVVAFVNMFVKKHQDFMIMALGKDNSFVDFIDCKDHIVDCCETPLALQFQLLKRSDIFVGVDSCMLHAADFYRLPSLGLFGPTDSKVWGFCLAPHRYIEGNSSMDNIDADTVLAALEEVLHEQGMLDL